MAHLTSFAPSLRCLLVLWRKAIRLPSLREGFSRPVLESMGYGVPPIVTDSGGCTEIVENGISGFVVPVKDADAIADKILELYENPQLIESMSTESRKKIDTEFSTRVSTDKYIRFFEALLENYP